MTQDLRDDYIARTVGQKTFVDVGGLWGTEGEKVSVAHKNGASNVCMLDVMPEDNEWWVKFQNRMADLGISNYTSISGDIHHTDVEMYDVVHSSGILYHLANPIEYLAKLRSIAHEFVILTSATTPTLIKNQYGTLKIPEGGAVFVPAMSETDKKIYAQFYTEGDDSVLLGGINSETIYMPHNYSPWWWLLPAETIQSMCESAGYEVMDYGSNWGGHAHTFLLKNTGKPDCLPTG